MQQNSSNNVNESEIDEETKEKLRGDAIGDSMYSRSSVLRTLMKLQNVDWNETLEEDLCFLWDMTMEKEVCQLLFEVNYPTLACGVVAKHLENERLIEIIVGILANILISGEGEICKEEIEQILMLLSSDDPLILIQVMRFIVAVTHRQKPEFVTREILDQLGFILSNSMNVDLLLKSLDTLAKLTKDYRLDPELIHGDLLKHSLEAFRMFNKELNLDLDIEENRKAVTYLMEITNNLCAYATREDTNYLNSALKSYNQTFLDISNKVLSFLSSEDNLFPLTETKEFYLEVILFFCETLDVKCNGEILENLRQLLRLLDDCREEVAYKTCWELVGYVNKSCI